MIGLHMDIYRTTNIPKYRSFQYRLLQRGLVTNVQLAKWGIKNSPMCHFCGICQETIIHLLWECEEVKKLWKKVEGYIVHRFHVHPCMTARNILFNSIVNKSRNVVNFICLIVKQFIYKQKCLNEQLHFPLVKDVIKSTENIEKYIAIKNGKLSLHQRKWEYRKETGNTNRNVNGNDINNFVYQYLNDM